MVYYQMGGGGGQMVTNRSGGNTGAAKALTVLTLARGVRVVATPNALVYRLLLVSILLVPVKGCVDQPHTGLTIGGVEQTCEQLRPHCDHWQYSLLIKQFCPVSCKQCSPPPPPLPPESPLPPFLPPAPPSPPPNPLFPPLTPKPCEDTPEYTGILLEGQPATCAMLSACCCDHYMHSDLIQEKCPVSCGVCPPPPSPPALPPTLPPLPPTVPSPPHAPPMPAVPPAPALPPQLPPSTCVCTHDCVYESDGDCDDGGPGFHFDSCAFGTECVRGASPALWPSEPILS